jgi:tRNA G18 (ribose-2'-O)-methylase SpoU
MQHWQRITDLADSRLDSYRALKQTNDTRWSADFIAEGDKVVERLLQSPYHINSVLIADRHVEQWRERVPPQVPVWQVPDDAVEQLIGFNFHRGVLACGVRPVASDPRTLTRPLNSPVTLLICDQVQNPENLGAILRLAAGFGVQGVVLSPGCADPFSRRVLRVSMGFALWLPLFCEIPLLPYVQELQSQDQVATIATVLDETAPSLRDCQPVARQAIILGNEGHGITPEVQAICSQRVTIPMHNGVDSLNVAITAGIALHHWCR